MIPPREHDNHPPGETRLTGLPGPARQTDRRNIPTLDALFASPTACGAQTPDQDRGRAGEDTLAARLDARDVFDALRRRWTLPADWTALVIRTHDVRDVAPPGSEIQAREALELFFARTTPWPLHLEVDRLVSADAHTLSVRVRTTVRVVPSEGDLLALRQGVGPDGRITRLSLACQFETALHPVLDALTAATPINELYGEAGRSRLAEVARKELERCAFLRGLTLEPPLSVEPRSETYERQRRSAELAEQQKREFQAAEALREAKRSERIREAENLSTVIAKLESLTATSSDLPGSALIRTFAEQERARIYESLLSRKRSLRRTEAFALVAGDEMLLYAAEGGEAPLVRVPLRGPAGPPRSIRCCASDSGRNDLLLVGAATGVYAIRRENNAITHILTVGPDPPSIKGGFNSIALLGDHVLASHSELGVHRWSLNAPDSPSRLLLSNQASRATSIRAVQTCGGRVFCAVGNAVLAWDGSEDNPTSPVEFAGSGAAITALLAHPTRGVFVGTAEGAVLHWLNAQIARPEVLHVGRQRPVESVVLIESEGVTRLIYTDTSPAVYARVLGDTVTWRYEASGQTLRRAAAAEDVLVAMTELRDRLLLFDSASPDRPAAVVNVARQCGHTIQDFCLLPQQKGDSPAGRHS